MEASSSSLRAVLRESRRLGLLGPGDVDRHIEHAEGYGRALVDDGPDGELLVADLGAGGGIPSLPLAVAFDRLRLVLIDAAAKRISFLVWAVVELDLGDRVKVVRGRAEELGHRAEHRFAYDAVVARSFGPPAMTLECAAPLLRPGGRCVISEPPRRRAWATTGLAGIGLAIRQGPPGYAVFERTGDVADRYPRTAREQRAGPVPVEESAAGSR